jgi:hypothetical protein
MSIESVIATYLECFPLKLLAEPSYKSTVFSGGIFAAGKIACDGTAQGRTKGTRIECIPNQLIVSPEPPHDQADGRSAKHPLVLQ